MRCDYTSVEFTINMKDTVTCKSHDRFVAAGLIGSNLQVLEEDFTFLPSILPTTG